MLEIVCASANAKKVAELQEILRSLGVELLPRPTALADTEETALTLIGNAQLKAQSVAEFCGQAALSDDTGLEVDALGGAPGVHTARFAGENASAAENNQKLLDQLRDFPLRDQRSARFRTVICVLRPDGKEHIAEGVVEGWIADELRGQDGFGYDPLFIPRDGDGRTFAEMSTEEKHAISHRGRALRALLENWPRDFS